MHAIPTLTIPVKIKMIVIPVQYFQSQTKNNNMVVKQKGIFEARQTDDELQDRIFRCTTFIIYLTFRSFVKKKYKIVFRTRNNVRGK